MLTFIAVCLLVLFVGFTFIAWFASQVVGYFIIKWFYKNVLGKPIEEKKDYRGNETYTLFNKERSCITGHIVRRCFLPSGDWVLRDCQTGDTLYNYTQEQRMLKQETLMSEQDKLIQEAKDLGWGCYYSVNDGRCIDRAYWHPRIEFATGKEIWTTAEQDYGIYCFQKMYLAKDRREDSDWIDISLKEYLSLSPKVFSGEGDGHEVISKFIEAGIIKKEGKPDELKFSIDYDKEIRLFQKKIIRTIRKSLSWNTPEDIYEMVGKENNALQKELKDCKELHGDEIINKLLEDKIIEIDSDKEELSYKLNVTKWIQNFEEFHSLYMEARNSNDYAFACELEKVYRKEE